MAGRKKKKDNKIAITILLLLLAVILGILCWKLKQAGTEDVKSDTVKQTTEDNTSQKLSAKVGDLQLKNESIIGKIPAYDGQAYVVINNNTPFFDTNNLTTDAFECYSDLDELGRCGSAFANICEEIMPTEHREEIGSVKPTGWHNVKYETVDGHYLYNRCHLIGFQLAGENANEKNLITGTRYMNVDGMLPFENMVDDFVEETGSHVFYRVTPIFSGDNLVADGVLMEAMSVEDEGKELMFNVFCYNIQKDVVIDYESGESFDGDPKLAAEVITVDTQVLSEQDAEAGDINAKKQTNHSSDSKKNTAVNEKDSKMVWVTKSGKCYHSINNCGTMNSKKAQNVTEQEALDMGKYECPNCW